MAEAVPPGGGYIQVLPVILQAGMSVTQVSTSLLPWSSPGYGAVLGQSQGEAALVVMYEWPVSWVAAVQDLPKYEREWLCLRAVQRGPGSGWRGSRLRGDPAGR